MYKIEYKEDAIYLITRIYFKVNRYLTKELTNRNIKGFAPSHSEIIGILFMEGRLQMKEIAELIDKGKSTVTTLVEKLLKMKYVKKERDKVDNRICYISLTKKGRDLVPILNMVSKELNQKSYSSITEKEKKQLVKLLSKLFNNF